MITLEQLERFKKFDGDVDKWVASQKRDRDELLNGNEWDTIDKVMQRLKLQKTGFASNDFRQETERVLIKTFGSPETVQVAKGMV